jgi:tetratricopeptide (TPR) repeat protein
MTMKKMLIFFTVIFCFQISLCYAFDWKTLHEEADKTGLSDANAAVQARPDSVADLYLLGLVYLNGHKNKEAGGIFDKIISLEPGSVEGRWGRAEVLIRMHKVDEGARILGEILKSNPGFSPVLISLSYAEYIKLNFRESTRFALTVIKQGRDKVDLSNYTRAYLLYSGARGMMAHYSVPPAKIIYGLSVLPNLRKAEKLKPNSPAVLYGLGSFHLLAPSFAGQDIDEAEIYLRKAIAKDPLFADAYVRLAQVYKVKKDKAKYQANLNKALEIDPRNELALDIKNGECKFICIGKD